MALSLQRAQLFAASAQLAFGPLNRDSGAGARAGWVLEDPPRRSGSKGRRGKESRPLRSSGRRDRDVEM